MKNIALFCFIALMSLQVSADEKLKIFTWEGYVTDADINRINLLLKKEGYKFQAQVIETKAEDAEQMFSVIRSQQCDITFLTLFFIKMQGEQTSKLLQTINTDSPRLSNYQFLDPKLTNLSMGMSSKKPLYIPWGGGIYGFFINADKVNKQDMPTSINDLWSNKWKNRFSLNQGQFWYNVSLSLQALNYPPFYLDNLAKDNNRLMLKTLTSNKGAVSNKLTDLYQNSGGFWQASTTFSKDLDIVSSWGPEIVKQNANGGNWQLIDFQEGHLAWLDTINFVRGLKGRKLEAAEIVANYFIGKKVQQRIASDLSMLPAATNLKSRGLLDKYPNLFNSDLFVPPFTQLSYSVMQQMNNRATEKK